MMKPCILAAISACSLTLSTLSAEAALLSRLSGQAFYDDQLDITWLSDANYAKTSGYDSDGKMTYSSAKTWATNLSIDGIRGWRLANINVNGDYSVDDCQYSPQASCMDNELGHLVYYGEGAINGDGIYSDGTGPFSNIQTGDYYWSTDQNIHPTDAYLYRLDQYPAILVQNKSYEHLAWAVHDGDVANVSTVPVPAAAWLFSSGLMGLAGYARRKSN